ncbi:hypothetical protein TNCV_2814171 [Trichonephila clavipes]|nr:hypothetical protein TNCV_2814171 [Trichonephila clavipes]
MLKEALQLLNCLHSDKSDVEIAVLSPDANGLTDEGKGDENGIHTGNDPMPSCLKKRYCIGVGEARMLSVKKTVINHATPLQNFLSVKTGR